MSHRSQESAIRASELSLYGFCRRAWWLGAVLGLPSANRQALAEGVARHEQHAGSLRRAINLRWGGLLLLVLGILAAVAAWWLGLGG